MFGFINKVFVVATSVFSYNLLKCISINNQECKIGPKIKDIISNEPSFYPFYPYSFKISKCNCSSNNINDS